MDTSTCLIRSILHFSIGGHKGWIYIAARKKLQKQQSKKVFFSPGISWLLEMICT